MQQQPKSKLRPIQRLCALALSVCLLAGLLPQGLPAARADWLSDALNKLVSWDIMRGDQAGNLDPARSITRAEFVSMVNRAFGYNKAGDTPFKDVSESAWYADDIAIAYHAGYFKGTGESTASPSSTLTREEAATIICRNVMVQPETGEALSFKDGREMSSWSRGYIKAASSEGFIQGYSDGSFRPKSLITRGEVASMLSSVIGTLVNKPQTYSSSVSGNLMVSTSGVTLQNMTITGDLYITPGVGLGYVTLENVTVLGKIVASGAGEGNKGDSSIIIKNSTISKIIVDSPTNQFVSIRTSGSTKIDQAFVRTPTYIEDKAYGKNGFQYIAVDGEEGTRLDLSGNPREVITFSKKSIINVGSGTVEKLTVDEAAVDTVVTISEGAVVESLNLDGACEVKGKGDVTSLIVNAAGCTVEMLPDQITIRPGITAKINGETMDSNSAQQSSDTPRLLSGYPRIVDLAPTSVEALFKTNKVGHLYWAIRESGEGPLSAANIIKPPSYGAKITKSGNTPIKEANKELSQKITGLKLGTSYILSAVMVDSRDKQSAVKNLYFTTPDDSKPAFASGYPKMSKVENNYGIADIVTTKDCRVYWALYNKGRPAPTANDFKGDTLPGSLGKGSFQAIRSEEESVEVPSATHNLKELEDYELYCFATDTVNDSAVVKVAFKTADRTPPLFNTNYPRIGKSDAQALTALASINEDGKVYWAAVRHGTQYPLDNPNLTTEAEKEMDRKFQIKGGLNAFKSGNVTATKDKELSMSISGLALQTAYDIYMIGEDKAGNLSEIKMIQGKTLDNTKPTLAAQVFSTPDADGNPMADTDITLTFSEDVYDVTEKKALSDLYAECKRKGDTNTWARVIKADFQLMDLSAAPNRAKELTVTLDTVTSALDEEGRTTVTFKKGALGLLSGNWYQFLFSNLRDSSNNMMGQNYAAPKFQTVYAQVRLTKTGYTNGTLEGGADSPFDITFSVQPVLETTQKMAEPIKYDLVFASDTSVSFDLYRKDTSAGATTWKLAKSGINISYSPDNKPWLALTLNHIMGLQPAAYTSVRSIPEMTDYAIRFTKVNGNADSTAWDASVNMTIMCAAGQATDLLNLNNSTFTESKWNAARQTGGITSIGTPNDLKLTKVLTNTQAPTFQSKYPLITTGDSIANINVMLDRAGMVHYVIARYGTLQGTTIVPDSPSLPPLTTGLTEIPIDDIAYANLTDNPLLPGPQPANLGSPNSESILSKSYGNSTDIQQGQLDYKGSGAAATISIKNLSPNTAYLAYFVLKGSAATPSRVYVYKFATAAVSPPKFTMTSENPAVGFDIRSQTGGTDMSANVNYVFYPYTLDQYPSIFDTKIKIGTVETSVLAAMKNGTFDNWTGEVPGDTINATDFREQLWREVTKTQGTAGQLLNQGKIDNLSGYSNVNFKDYMRANNQYIAFAGAQNVLGGPYIFRAVSGLFLVDAVPPRVVSIQTSITGKKTDGTYYGSILLQFTKPIHVYDTSGTTPIAKPVVYGGTTRLPDNYVLAETLDRSGGLILSYTGTGITALQSISMTFSGAREGSFFAFTERLSDVNGSQREQVGPIFTFNATRKIVDEAGNEKIVPRFELSDGTISETES